MHETAAIVFSENGFQDLIDHLDRAGLMDRQKFVLVDSNTAEVCLPYLLERVPQLNTAQVLEIEASESSKNVDVVHFIHRTLLSSGADRSSLIINLGGGVVSDIGGFVASTFKRGMPYINIPTTLLSQVDAAIGGKTAVNLDNFKNLIGTFYQPEFVFIQTDFLNTLSKEHVVSGFAEMVKHALIADRGLWTEMEAMKELDLERIKGMISRAAHIKQDIVAQDFKENGQRKALNFGHTIGHALESFSLENSRRALLHGEAVALGILCESHISKAQGMLKRSDLDDICRFIGRHFPHYQLDKLSHHRIIEIMNHDKKKRGDELNMTLLKDIGEPAINQNPKNDLIIDSLNYLSRYPFAE